MRQNLISFEVVQDSAFPARIARISVTNANGKRRVKVCASNAGDGSYSLAVSLLDGDGRFRDSNSNKLTSGDMARAMDDCIEKSLAAMREQANRGSR